ncbi:hypothetical protein Pmani_001603 [Petrolisthes manimaculis]|uniref:SAM domain-containing protein n=1 Tax=Petrolisthes manimaculis TaxID=1843537 RepID=A0AAE1QK78_9EUCA|nr:hypothetical protein Pmani_001603 [Petrolisthes manimaculis]
MVIQHLTTYELGCVVVDELCLEPEEVPNYEAIKSLHYQLDDDRSGDIDLSESVDFLKEELQYAKGYEKRQKVFHYNNDQYISVRELWYIWKKSEVHNWTVDQTVAWLAESVELQQYANNFYENAVNGSILPRMAANNEQFLTKVLGIKDPKHRSKITIKAMDVVLFGPPKGSHVKDLVLVSLLTLALIGCFKAYQRNREYQGQLSEMLKDMEKLREAEENLQQLEQKMTTKVHNDEDAGSSQSPSTDENTSQEVQQLKLQLEEEREKNEQMKEQMKRSVEDHLELTETNYVAPPALQHWLQLTFERERIAFEKKQSAAREQFSQARELCEKLNRQRRSLMGMLASVHGKMDNVDQSISQARTIMEEVTQELREREQRWTHIEDLAGCSVTTNPGLHTLELMLRPHVNTRPHTTYGSSIGASSYHHSLGGSPVGARTPGESTADLRVMGTSGSLRKRSHQLLPRDSGSSLGSESGITHSLTFTDKTQFGGTLGESGNENIRRVCSVGSLQHHQHLDTGKDSNDSSTDETDFSIGTTDNTSFSLGGSRLTLNSEGGGSVSQVSGGNPLHSVPSSTSPKVIGGSGGGVGEVQKPSPNKRGLMLKSYSHDTDVAHVSETRLEDKEKMSASDPALDSPKLRSSALHNKKNMTAPVEEGNSSDSSAMEDQQVQQLRQQLQSAKKTKTDSLKKSKNGLLGSFKFSKSKKNKETEQTQKKS